MTVHNDGRAQINAAAMGMARVAAPIQQTPGRPNRQPARINSGGTENGFAKILDQASHKNGTPELKISKHAEARLHDRNIQLSGAQRDKIAGALAKAGNKGVRDALVMIDGLAIVANTKSMTVITAVGEGDMQQNIFTNIDGAVLI